jgi:hypothetical protein
MPHWAAGHLGAKKERYQYTPLYCNAIGSLPLASRPLRTAHACSRLRQWHSWLHSPLDCDCFATTHAYADSLPACIFLSGGTLSNFPMHLFVGDIRADNTAPLCPTLGVRLGQDRSGMQAVNDAGVYLGSMFDTSRNLLDRQFLFNNPLHAHEWVGVSDCTWYTVGMLLSCF